MIDRLHRLREAAAAIGADAAIVSHPANRHYFSGFPADDHAPDESSGILVVAEETAILFTSPTNLPWAESAVTPPVIARPWSRPWPEFLGQELQSLGIRCAAFEDRALSVADHAGIQGAARNIRLVAVDNAFHALRAVKSEQELSRIAEAVRITDAAFAERSRTWSPALPRKRWRGGSRPRCTISARMVPASRSSSPPDHTVRDRITSPAIDPLRKASRSSSTWAPWSEVILPTSPALFFWANRHQRTSTDTIRC